jgi:hypothetical protein
MDDAVQRFRRQVGRELGDREGAERRYSVGLRQQAVATALGIAPVSLRRWAEDARFRPVRLFAEAPAPARLVVIVDATGVRVEGADVETAAPLIARLR